MAEVTREFYDLWRSQSSHFGPGAEPTVSLKIRRGRFQRAYGPWAGPPITATILGGNNTTPWQATWVPDGEWHDLPGPLEVRLEQGFDNNGVQIATIQIENIHWEEGGVDNLIHLIQRGALAPFRGYSSPGRPAAPVESNQYFELMRPNSQITVYEGYGGLQVPTFTGLIDDTDLTSHPDRITITARDFGKVLVEEEFFGNNHDPLIREPITFVDREWKTEHEGYAPRAATEAAHHPASYVVDKDKRTYWLSRMYNTTHATDWVHVHLPQGNYSSFYLWPRYQGMRAYVSVFVRARDDGHACRFNGEIVAPNQWIDIGLGDVPGANGGFPFIREMPNIDDVGRYYRFGESGPTMQVGDGTVLRISFRDLAPVTEDDAPAGEPTSIGYRAGVRRLFATRRVGIKASDADKQAHHIFIDDIADAVKVILRWAGFKEWNIESTGVRLKKPLVFNRGDHFIDAINKLAESTNYVFFMADPSADDLSIGIPTFRQARVVTEDQPVAEVRDIDLLTGIQVKLTDEPLGYSIRVRGREVSNFGPDSGYLIGGGDVRRVKFTYYPPWAREWNELAGILKHVLHTDNKLTTAEDCEFACYYIALKEALESATGVIEIPGYPGFELDSFASVVDEGTGMNTRLWIAARTSTFTTGEKKTWKQTLSGTWVDVPEVVAIKQTINNAVKSNE